jgi:hypothetical protein
MRLKVSIKQSLVICPLLQPLKDNPNRKNSWAIFLLVLFKDNLEGNSQHFPNRVQNKRTSIRRNRKSSSTQVSNPTHHHITAPFEVLLSPKKFHTSSLRSSNRCKYSNLLDWMRSIESLMNTSTFHLFQTRFYQASCSTPHHPDLTLWAYHQSQSFSPFYISHCWGIICICHRWHNIFRPRW